MASDEAKAYRAKLLGLQFQPKGPRPNATKTTVVYDDDRGGGRVAGRQVEHKDGHVDAVITPPVTAISSKVNQ
jgi:hypothetical protein